MYAIICAVPEELQALITLFGTPEETNQIGAFKLWRYSKPDVVIAQSGIGKVNSSSLTTAFCMRFPNLKGIIFSGIAGALNPDLEVGDLVLGKQVGIVDYGLYQNDRLIPVEYGVLPIGAPALEAIPSVQPKVQAVLEALAQDIIRNKKHQARVGRIITADYFLNCVEQSSRLLDHFQADAFDMESGAVFHVAQAFGIPAYIIRTISDKARSDSHISYAEMASLAAENASFCVSRLLELLLDSTD